MTSSYRGPDYPLDASERRIELLRRVTARSIAGQGWDPTWIVYVNPNDPLLSERLDAFRSSGHPVVPVQENAEAEAVIDWSGDVLTTRIDDDDAFAAGAFHRLYQALRRPPQVPTALIFPVGYHVRDGLVQLHRHLRNAWPSVYSPAGFREHVRKHQHQRIPGAYPTVQIDTHPGWLRVSHRDNGAPTSHRPKGQLTPAVRSLFDVDWSLLERQAVAA